MKQPRSGLSRRPKNLSDIDTLEWVLHEDRVYHENPPWKSLIRYDKVSGDTSFDPNGGNIAGDCIIPKYATWSSCYWQVVRSNHLWQGTDGRRILFLHIAICNLKHGRPILEYLGSNECVRHICGNSRCLEHLAFGTPSQNSVDDVNKRKAIEFLVDANSDIVNLFLIEEEMRDRQETIDVVMRYVSELKSKNLELARKRDSLMGRAESTGDLFVDR